MTVCANTSCGFNVTILINLSIKCNDTPLRFGRYVRLDFSNSIFWLLDRVRFVLLLNGIFVSVIFNFLIVRQIKKIASKSIERFVALIYRRCVF